MADDVTMEERQSSESEWEEELVYIDLPELHKTDPAMILNKIDIQNWDTLDAKLILNDKFCFTIYPEVLPGTLCSFSTKVDPASSTRADLKGVVDKSYTATLVSKKQAIKTELLDTALLNNPLMGPTDKSATFT